MCDRASDAFKTIDGAGARRPRGRRRQGGSVHDEGTEGARDSWGPNGVQLVASMAEKGVEFSVLVTVPGGLIAGTTINEKSYFAGLGDAYRKAGAKELGAVLAALRDSAPAEESDDSREFHSLFLKNGKFVIGGTPLGGDGLFIRVRISAISALALGTLKAQ